MCRVSGDHLCYIYHKGGIARLQQLTHPVSVRPRSSEWLIWTWLCLKFPHISIQMLLFPCSAYISRETLKVASYPLQALSHKRKWERFIRCYLHLTGCVGPGNKAILAPWVVENAPLHVVASVGTSHLARFNGWKCMLSSWEHFLLAVRSSSRT